MVWGMNLPSSFGEFWPSGEFEYDPKTREDGWGERLRSHYRAQAPDVQTRLFDYRSDYGNAAHFYSGYVAGKFISEIGTAENRHQPAFTPIQPHEPPQSFKADKSYATLGSLIKFNNRILGVNEALKAIIERLEPGVHQFFPIEIQMPRGKVFPKAYYTLVIGQYFDSFSPESSKPGSCQLDIVRYRYERTKAGVAGLAFRKSVFGKAHLWRERRIIGLLTCFSDKLVAEINESGLRIPKHYKMKEV